MGISAITGHEIKSKESEKLQAEIDIFLKSGGKIDKRNNLGQSINESGDIVNFDKPELTVRFNESLSEGYMVKQKKLHTSKINEKEARLKEQSSFINKYLESSSNSGFWNRLVLESEGAVSVHTLRRLANGQVSIACPDKWKKVKDAAQRLMNSGGNVRNRIGRANNTSRIEKEKRSAVQRPLFVELRELYQEKAFGLLSKRLNSIVSAPHLHDCWTGRNSIACPRKWMKIRAEINKMIREKQNEAA